MSLDIRDQYGEEEEEGEGCLTDVASTPCHEHFLVTVLDGGGGTRSDGDIL